MHRAASLGANAGGPETGRLLRALIPFIIKLGSRNPCGGCAHLCAAGGLDHHSWRFRLPQLDIMTTTAAGWAPHSCRFPQLEAEPSATLMWLQGAPVGPAEWVVQAHTHSPQALTSLPQGQYVQTTDSLPGLSKIWMKQGTLYLYYHQKVEHWIGAFHLN